MAQRNWLGELNQDEADRLEARLTILEVKASKLKRVKEQVVVEAARNELAVTIEVSARLAGGYGLYS